MVIPCAPKPPIAPQATLSDLVSSRSMRSGDVILTTSTGSLAAWLIKVGTQSAFTHVGCLKVNGGVSVMHSHANVTGRDKFSKGWVEGFQTNDLVEFMESYRGRVFWRSLYERESPHFPRPTWFDKALDMAYDDLSGIRYETNWWSMVRSAFPWLPGVNRSIAEESKNLFCSEALAIIGARMGWLELKDYAGHPKKPRQFTPEDFSFYQGDTKLSMSPAWRLAPEVEIVL